MLLASCALFSDVCCVVSAYYVYVNVGAFCVYELRYYHTLVLLTSDDYDRGVCKSK